jgi:hypothetical protein
VKVSARFRLISLLALLIGASVLYACDGGTPQPPSGQTPTPTGSGPVTGDRTITFETVGGIAGIERELVVTPEGFATLTDRGTTYGPTTLPRERRDEIMAKLDATNFSSLQERYGTGTVADDFQHNITIEAGGSSKTVMVEAEGGKGVTPASLQEFIALMTEVETELRQAATTTPTAGARTYAGKLIFTGVREVTNEKWQMTITDDGKATIVDGDKELGTIQVPEDQLDLMRDELERARFFDLQAYYGTGAILPNDRVFTIHLQTESGAKIVSMEEHGGLNVTPEATRNLFDQVERIFLSSRLQLQGTPATP